MGKKKQSQSVAQVENGFKVVQVNKKARHDYEIVEVFEAGIVLAGSEVKSIRGGEVNLKESYVKFKGDELFLVGCHISPYSHSRVDAHDPIRDKKLLMHRREIDKLIGKIQQKGLTIVPLRLYFKQGRCKVEIGLGRGKKLHDKRQDMKTREAVRDMARAMHGRG